MVDILINVLIVCVCLIVIGFTTMVLILLWKGTSDALKNGKNDDEKA